MVLRAAELFAGVGGFRLGLERAGHEVVWSNQWEPGAKVQHASDCYVRHFGAENHSNIDIHDVNPESIPEYDLLVGGFPCQDYSVAATLDKSRGIKGKKGVLWWQIDRILKKNRPPYLLLENVDRLLRSPAHKRGRDFGMVLSSLAKWGYRVEWRVINAADYGFAHKRRRVFIFGAHKDTPLGKKMASGPSRPNYLLRDGFFARAFPVVVPQVESNKRRKADVKLKADLVKVSRYFSFEFSNAGVMVDRRVWTRKVEPKKEPFATLESKLEATIPTQYHVPQDQIRQWKYLKDSKNEERVAKNGHKYRYVEGALPWPDKLDQPARTILTSEGGTGPSRSNHILPLKGQDEKFRVLMPIECERLNDFPDDWTKGMPERWRYFCMGNALVVGLIERMARHLAQIADPALEAAVNGVPIHGDVILLEPHRPL